MRKQDLITNGIPGAIEDNVVHSHPVHGEDSKIFEKLYQIYI